VATFPARLALFGIELVDETDYAEEAGAFAPAARRFADAAEGAIINLWSVVGLAPEFDLTVYGATKAFVLSSLRDLASSSGPKAFTSRRCCLPEPTRRSGRTQARTLMPFPD
jgi:short chain dehydrogenase